jgi:hypothetical protein
MTMGNDIRDGGRELRTEMVIAAPAERVWEILTDFEELPSWNPFIRSASGRIAVGERLDLFLQPPGGRGMRFRPTVMGVTPGRELHWLGHLLVPGIFDGEHSFRIEPIGRGEVRFIQSECFGGMLLPLFRRMLVRDTLPGFEAMNRALKERAEKG